MCGIIGYIGYKPAASILLNCLKRLEYRGYDSCGLALLGDAIEVYKAVGRVESLERCLPRCPGTIGVGHTRWATHGAVTRVNAHPHLDCNGKIAVVHNGVVENFCQLREQLIREGHRFRSETDTEVLPHLIEKYYQGDIEQALSKAIAEVSGSFALLVLHVNSRQLVAACEGSSLVVGIGHNENFVASDVAALLGYADRVVYLEDNDICLLSESSIAITNGGEKVTRQQQKITWDVEEVQKARYEHFMLKEIHEQPKVIESTFADYDSAAEPSVNLGLEKGTGLEDIVLLACGTSYHAALVGEYLLGKLCHIPVRVKIASEFNHYEMMLDKSWVIGITQSGETADTVKALKKAKGLGCKTLAIVNIPRSTATRICDQTFYLRAGLETSVAATKTFMSQLVAMYLLALSQATANSKTRSSLIQELRLLPVKVQWILDDQAQIARRGIYLAKYQSIFFVARGINYPIAMEGALKLKEIAYIHAEACPAGELKHGPFALLRQETPVIAIATKDDTYKMMLINMDEIKARGSPLIAIAEEDNRDIERFADDVIRIPGVHPLLSPVLNAVVVQLLAYYVARERGCPIDIPTNLAKTVTVP